MVRWMQAGCLLPAQPVGLKWAGHLSPAWLQVAAGRGAERRQWVVQD